MKLVLIICVLLIGFTALAQVSFEPDSIHLNGKGKKKIHDIICTSIAHDPTLYLAFNDSDTYVYFPKKWSKEKRTMELNKFCEKYFANKELEGSYHCCDTTKNPLRLQGLCEPISKCIMY